MTELDYEALLDRAIGAGIHDGPEVLRQAFEAQLAEEQQFHAERFTAMRDECDRQTAQLAERDATIAALNGRLNRKVACEKCGFLPESMD